MCLFPDSTSYIVLLCIRYCCGSKEWMNTGQQPERVGAELPKFKFYFSYILNLSNLFLDIFRFDF